MRISTLSLTLPLALVIAACATPDQETTPPTVERLADPVLDDTRGTIRNSPRATPGYTLYGGLVSDTTYLIGNDGLVVRTWKSKYAPAGTAYLLDNGNILRGGREPDVPRFNGGGQGGRIEELSWEGEIVWHYVYATDGHLLHHDLEPMPNGNILAISWEHIDADKARAAGRRVDLLPEHGLWPDKVVELEPIYPDDARVVWEWHAKDHLVQDRDETLENYGDPSDHPHRIDINGAGGTVEVSAEELAQLQTLGYVPQDANAEDLSADLFHTNAVHYDAEFDQIALSVPEYNEVWIIDHSTTTAEATSSTGGRSGRGGDLLYRWGNPQVYGRGTADDQLLGYQHDVRWIPAGYPGAGHLMIFSNRNGTEEMPHSTVYEIAPPTDADGHYILADDAPFGPVAPVWSYRAAEASSFYASFISGAHRLATGHTLVSSGPQGRFFEITADGEIVWEYRDPYSGQVRLPDGSLPHPVGEFTYAVFRATRIAADHPAIAGRTLTPLDPQPEIIGP